MRAGGWLAGYRAVRVASVVGVAWRGESKNYGEQEQNSSCDILPVYICLCVYPNWGLLGLQDTQHTDERKGRTGGRRVKWKG